MADDLKVKVQLELDDKLDASKMKKEAEKAGQDIGEWVNKWMSTAIAKWMAIWEVLKGSIQKVWSAIKEFLQDSISLANTYESAFAWVRKTVDWTTKDFIKLNNSLKKMAKEIPLSYKDLAGIMELWWQLGVQTKDLDKFTRSVAQLGTATNLTSENAAQMLAQFANITQMDLNDIDKLGSVIVDLGNNFATTESNIVNFAQRIAGAGQIAWISQANIMAIATAFSSVGIEAEAWGTAVQKVLLDMNSAVTMWGEQLELYAKIVWKTTEEFKNLYKEHPEQAFVEFVKALQNSGQEAQWLLDELGLNDQRLVRGFLSLSQNADILTEAINRSNKAWADNVALSTEAEQRYSTAESQILMQQNERANMMAAIGEKLQGVVALWEEVKTTFVNAIGSFMWITMESNEATEALEAQIKKVIWLMNDLDLQLQNGEITIEEWAKQRIQLEEDAKQMEEALKKEKKRLEELSDAIDYANNRMEYYSHRYEFLMKNREKYSANWEQEAELMKRYYEDWAGELENLMIIQNAWKDLTDEEVEAIKRENQQRVEEEKLIKSVEAAEKLLNNAKKEYNDLKVDDSATRAELEKSRQKVIILTKAYEALLNKMTEAWIGVARKGKDKSRLTADRLNKLSGWWSSGWSSSDNGWVVGEELFGWDSKGGGWWGSKSKAEDMAESFRKEMKELYSDMDSSISEHQRNYDKLVDSIEDAEKEYDKLRETATKTWKDAEKAIKDYNKQLEENQAEWIKSLWERYVDLQEKWREIDNEFLKKRVGEISDADWKRIRDEWYNFYGYDYEELKDIKEIYDEIKLIEANTTEDQRKSAEFTEKTSKTQEILNSMKEKEAELEEKKAIAMEKQAIAQAMMSQENWKQYIKTLEDKGTFYYDTVKKQREQVLNEDNIEYAKELENQSVNLNDQLQQFKDEKDNEVEILATITARKIELENDYNKTFQDNISKQKQSVQDLIIKRDELIARKDAYYWISTNARRAYGWALSSWVTLVGENWPEAVVSRVSSYVQPQNASSNYSTVNNDNSFSINWMAVNVNNIDDFLDELRQKFTYRS